ncbi:hypothetical protein ABEW34_12370 [Paenibacillus algorifonticola]|uniref:hypothetical protein n=1 Tax=Paenibacillus algorifonticola TaxID=684063 RepID=UPI003D2CC216
MLRGSIVEGQTFNRFGYVNGDPVSFIDPFGLEAMIECSKGKAKDKVVVITLKYDKKMPKNEFERKAKKLKELGDQGLLYKAQNPVSRDPNITKQYRQDMIKRIWNQYGKGNPVFA